MKQRNLKNPTHRIPKDEIKNELSVSSTALRGELISISGDYLFLSSVVYGAGSCSLPMKNNQVRLTVLGKKLKNSFSWSVCEHPSSAIFQSNKKNNGIRLLLPVNSPWPV
jgi:hypothetical protein